MMDDKLLNHIIADLDNAKDDLDVMRTLCCGYYAFYVAFSKDDRDKLDDCAKGVRVDALRRAKEWEDEISSGYIIKED